MGRVRLILTDIDGTVLPKGRRAVSSRTVAAFHAALDAGLVVGPASGRGYSWIPAFFGGDLACCATALATNGLQVYHEGAKVLERALPREALLALRDLVSQVPGAGLLCFDGPVPLLVEGSVDDLARAFPAYAETCERADGVPSFDVVKANVFVGTSPEAAAGLVARANGEISAIDVDRALPCFSNVMPRGWNKGAAIAWLCDRLEIGLDEVVVFGDADNDLTMFSVVPNSVAVAGATPEAASAARWHIGRCEDDAVAAAIESLAAGGWPFDH